MIEQFTKRDRILIGVCIAVVAVSLFVIYNWFYTAFPEASIEFKFDRDTSLPIAKRVLDLERIDAGSMKHAAVFTGDETAKIFLERTVGLSAANQIMRTQVRLWWWEHRWFKPLQEEEFAVDVAPTGEIVGFNDKIPESRALPAIDAAQAQRIAAVFLARAGVRLGDLQLVAQSERTLPSRVQRIFTWDSQSVHPAGAPYRYIVTVDGDRVSSYTQRVKVPDQWIRDYEELRSKNNLAGQIDTVLFIITLIAALVIFIIRLLRGDVRVKLLLGVAIASVILVTGTSLNSFPSAVANYDTTTSYPAFIAHVIINALFGGIGVAMLLAVMVGSGEVLYRERLPQHLAIPKIWRRDALASKRVFLSFVLGYALVAFFLAYQVAFYLIADRFGAWSPAEVPYDDMLNTAFPWVAVLFAGFFPALSEEFTSRAFSIPFFEWIFRPGSRVPGPGQRQTSPARDSTSPETRDSSSRAMRDSSSPAALESSSPGTTQDPSSPQTRDSSSPGTRDPGPGTVGRVGTVVAVVLAGFIWGFGHATYPNQPFFIRGLEVGLVGCFLGVLLFRFGLLPLLIWHYSVDAIYTAMLLVRSGNTYYVISGLLASFVFAIPMVISLVLYFRNGGFVADAELSNATIPIHPAPERTEREKGEIVYPAAPAIAQNRWLLCIGVVAIACVLAATRPTTPDDALDYRTTADQAKQTAAPNKIGTMNLVAPQEGFRSWDASSQREDGGSPDGFDGVALDYLLHRGLRPDAIVNVLRSKVEAGVWMVRSFTPLQKDETFTEIDARTGRIIGYHRYQDEKKVGARFDQPQALGIARSAFAKFGANINQFELKEALAFQQPNRRDWLFHFQERTPIVAQAFRRVSVRVAGSQVTQFTTTIKIPEDAYREAAKTTFLNVLFGVLRIIGAIAVLSLIVAGFVVAARKHFPWRRPLRWTLLLAIVPIAATVVRFRTTLFTYDTSIGWDAFVSSQTISAFVFAALQIGVLFLALAGIESVHPQALDWLRREGRARFGRPALVSALTALGILLIWRVALQWLANAFPSIGSAGGVTVSPAVNMAVPALLAIGEAIVRAVEVSAVVALFVAGVEGVPRADKYADTVALIALFFLILDPGAHGAAIVFMLLSTATAAALAWALVRFVLRDNFLAYPLAAGLASLLASAATLLGNHRSDLIANAIALIVAAVVVAGWFALPSRSDVTQPI